MTVKGWRVVIRKDCEGSTWFSTATTSWREAMEWANILATFADAKPKVLSMGFYRPDPS